MPVGELVGGAFLSAFLQVLFDRLASPEVANFIRGKKVDPKLLRRLETTLRVVRVVLDDAEKKQFKDPNVDMWLNDIKDVVYVADDLLDEIFIEAVTKKEDISHFSSLFNSQDREMASKLEDIVDRLESILKLKESLNLKEIAAENLSHRTPSTSLQDKAHVYGRDKDKEAIISLLLDDNEQVSVIPIVGMGGVGKTTLAQLVYNDDTLKDFFHSKAWVSVSEEFDIVKITKLITEAVIGETCKMNDLNLLHLNLHDKLKEKKFLVVLDDFCIEDYANWNLLKKCFQLGVRGSKILVTTRSENVASLVRTVETYHLDHLSDEDCWLIFANHACFSLGSGDNTAALEKIGREIVKKCAGLPLAAQSLGGILQSKHDIKDWENLLKNNIWELPESESMIIPALRVSYHYLPPELKRCFVYCSLFPKGYNFEKDELVLLWIAEDIISPPSKRKTLEEVGGAYFDYLVARSFLQPLVAISYSYVDGVRREKKQFGMHDLLHDLAIFLGGEFFFSSETKITMKTRHLSFTNFSQLLEKCEDLGEAKYLRTLLRIDSPFKFDDDGKEACILLSKLKHLRVVSFNLFRRLNTLSDSIGKLIHLRYLNLSRTDIATLPESLGNLFHLQTLILSYCNQLNMLPSSMVNLINLLRLDISGTSLKEMPQGMRKLTQLRHLSDYIVGKNEENGIKELGGVLNLEDSLSIKKLENVSNGSEALEAKMVDRKYIKCLGLTWSSAESCFESQMEMDIICNLQPHQDLEYLKIEGYRGTRFPDWVGNPSYGNMTNLMLFSCKNCCMLPSLGQLPTLKHLSISKFDKLVSIDDGFYKNGDSSMLTPFPFLETLVIEDMPYWEVWSCTDSCAFPKLKRLEIENCPKLKGDLPSQLPALVTLYVGRCMELACSLPRASSEGDCLPISLETLLISCSTRLKFPKKQTHKSLVSLRITSDSLTCLPLETFPNLQLLAVSNCENVECLSASQDCVLRNLEYLRIISCPKFVSFPREGLHAPSLIDLSIFHCEKLNSWPQQMNTLLPKLKHLTVSNCPGIASFPEGGMPPRLESITIINCEKLLSGPAWPSMEMLTKVTLNGPCDGIKSFPKEGLLPPSLVSLGLCNFLSLETLDCKGLLHLTSLESLSIKICPKLENIAEESSLPASLLELRILPTIGL